MVDGRVLNYTALKIVRVDHRFPVRHTEDSRLLRELFLEVCASDDDVLAYPKVCVCRDKRSMHIRRLTRLVTLL